MRLQDHCTAEAVLSSLEASDKEDALGQLVEALVAAKAIPKAKAPLIRKEIVERELQASTGIGRGIGIPHARSAHVKRISLAIGRVPGGLEFGAVDGERVKVILLLVSPVDQTEQHLAAMRAIVKMARDPYQAKRLHSCATPQSFLDLIAELDGKSA
ncbi:MAG: PTS sugar transporter subunit IIA [Planctomycetaceae bacterium]